ncbi:hypothetical protein [Isoptericola croceus]|uniref:hypothetical protein n=1 Tax=Isoptericola croceus TaxID=3031406 RepID=UPI0023F84477|nr:hypothetical protein [Isoptericola croceus]
MTIDSQHQPDRCADQGADHRPQRGRTVRTVTALVLLTMLGAGGLTACASSGGNPVDEDQVRRSAGGLSFTLPASWEYHEGLSWPGAWAPPGSDGGADGGPRLTVHTVDLIGEDFGTGALGQEFDVPGADGARYWHHDIPPEGGDLHEVVVSVVEDWVGVRVALAAGDLSDAASRDLFESVVASLEVDGENDWEAVQRFGPFTELDATGETAELPDLGDLPSGIPDGWGNAGLRGIQIGVPDGWLGDPEEEEEEVGPAWIHPGTGARIRVDKAPSSDTWKLTRDGTPFAMPGADIAVASASVVTDQTGQELVEVQIDVRRDGGRGYTAFVDAPAADLQDLLIPFLGSLSFQAEAGGTAWVNDLPEYPHLADPPASWTDARFGQLSLSVPETMRDESTGWYGHWTADDGELEVATWDGPTEKPRPGQTSVPVAGATSALIEIVEDHDLDPDYFVGTVEIVRESGDVYYISYRSGGEASEKTFGQILGSLTVDEQS